MKRVELILKDNAFMEHIAHNTRLETEHPFCKHDLAHMIDVARIAYILVLEKQDVDYFITSAGLSGKLAAKEVIYAAGLLHDIGKWQEYETGEDHAVVGARLAREILAKALFNDQETGLIVQSIYEHRNISRDVSFLGERLHRADNLSRVCSQCAEKERCYKYKNKEMGAYLLVY